MNSDQITQYINKCFKNIVDNKIKAFEQSVTRKYNFEKPCELKNPILCKHFIINAIDEFNNKLALKIKTLELILMKILANISSE